MWPFRKPKPEAELGVRHHQEVSLSPWHMQYVCHCGHFQHNPSEICPTCGCASPSVRQIGRVQTTSEFMGEDERWVTDYIWVPKPEGCQDSAEPDAQ